MARWPRPTPSASARPISPTRPAQAHQHRRNPLLRHAPFAAAAGRPLRLSGPGALGRGGSLRCHRRRRHRPHIVGRRRTHLSRRPRRVLIELNARHRRSCSACTTSTSRPTLPIAARFPSTAPPTASARRSAWYPPEKIAGIVETDRDDEIGGFAAPTEVTESIGQNVADFLAERDALPAACRMLPAAAIRRRRYRQLRACRAGQASARFRPSRCIPKCCRIPSSAAEERTLQVCHHLLPDPEPRHDALGLRQPGLVPLAHPACGRRRSPIIRKSSAGWASSP